MLSPVFAQTPNCHIHRCVAVVDAGSTGSRLHVFTYDFNEQQVPTNIQDFLQAKITPGFATIEAQQISVNQYLDKLFQNSDSILENMPVYFYATAGMRLVSTAKQKQMYTLLAHWFDNQTAWKLIRAKTISGKEEAIYDWFTVNYLSGRLNGNANLPLAGVVDVGGASIQVSFPMSDARNADPSDIENIELGELHIQLFVHSFLGLGTTELTSQMLDESSCFTLGYPLPSATGYANTTSCSLVLLNFINKVHHVAAIVKQPQKSNIVSDWYALGAAGYLPQTKPLEFENYEFTLQEIKEQGQNRVCSVLWDELSQEYPDPYLYQACLTSMYYPVLFSQGYGIAMNQLIHYFPAKQMPDWTIGVVLHQ